MIAAFLKASDNLAKMCHATVFADDAVFDIENKVHVFWHDDIVLHFPNDCAFLSLIVMVIW